MAKKEQPIADPAAHAAALSGQACRELARHEPWRGFVAFHTTGAFARTEDRIFHQHCGPTAITNLVCTIRRRRGQDPGDAAAIFAEAAAIGRRRLTYWNIDERFHLGGTSYLLLRPYVAACLRHFGLADTALTWRVQARPERMARELEQGRLLVLAMTAHGCYGSHLVLACGTVRVAVPGGADRLYLLVADGWSPRPRYIAADSLHVCGYVAVEAR